METQQLTALVVNSILFLMLFVVFVPKAQRKERSGFLWFLIGAMAFNLPVFVGTFYGHWLADHSYRFTNAQALGLGRLGGFGLGMVLTIAAAIVLHWLPKKGRARVSFYLSRKRARKSNPAS